MSEQDNPTADEETRMEPPARRGADRGADRGRSFEESEDTLDEETGDETSEEGDEETVSAPAEYVQRERSGRGRRIGSEVRPDDVDYKNIPLLSRFLDRRGRILSRRKTRVSAKVQRRIVTAIKRARHLALLPYTADQTRIVRRRR
jgi:small subunit ribosomal protein S18